MTAAKPDVIPDVLTPARLRQVFGAYPTGVVAVAAIVDDQPVGLAASSFASVSMDPPLVSVCVAHSSRTWPVLRRAPRLGISILSAEQAVAARRLSGEGDRFAELSWRITADGAVLVDGAAGWLDVSVTQQVTAGDHDIVVLAAHDLDVDHEVLPLVFHASQFRRVGS